jgi:hypothetical protein
MADSFVLIGLKRKRRQIAGLVVEHERKAMAWRAALAQVDGVLKLFDPELDPEKLPKQRTLRRSPYYEGHALMRLIWDALREADGQAVATDVFFNAAIRLGKIPDKPYIHRALRERILLLLNEKEKAGEIMRQGMGRNTTWLLPLVRLEQHPSA